MVYTQFFFNKTKQTNKKPFLQNFQSLLSHLTPPLFEINNGFNSAIPPKNYQKLCPRPRAVLYVVVSIMESVPL